MIVPILKGIGIYLCQSDMIWGAAQLLLNAKAPHIKKLGYEKRQKFAFLEAGNVPTPLPNITRPIQTEVKVELHQARRAGDHLDLRFKIGNKVYDFAVVRKTDFPKETGKLFRVQRTPNHSLRYFYTDKAEFPEGAYGAGTMSTAWRGKCIIIMADPTKIEFAIDEGPFKGKFCIREFGDKGTWALLKMREPNMGWQERQSFSSSKEVEKGVEYIAEEKIDGANYLLIPGSKENVLISRRLSVTGKPINKASHIPQLRFMKFPEELHGRRIHVEAVVPNRDVSRTSGCLNSLPSNGHILQSNSRDRLALYIWDIDTEGDYFSRRLDMDAISKASELIDWRRFGGKLDYFLAMRYVNGRLLRRPSDNHSQGMGIREFTERIKERGGEGVVLKRLDKGYYEDIWIKDKRVHTMDLEIVGFTPGKGRHTGSLGAIVARDPETFSQTNIGTGFSDQERAWIWRTRASHLGKIITCDAHEQTPGGSLRGPRFRNFHLDG